MQGNPTLGLVFAIPDHPWVDSSDGAAVRIAMTVGRSGAQAGVLQEVVEEEPTGNSEFIVKFAKQVGRIASDLSVGANISVSETLVQ